MQRCRNKRNCSLLFPCVRPPRLPGCPAHLVVAGAAPGCRCRRARGRSVVPCRGTGSHSIARRMWSNGYRGSNQAMCNVRFHGGRWYSPRRGRDPEADSRHCRRTAVIQVCVVAGRYRCIAWQCTWCHAPWICGWVVVIFILIVILPIRCDSTTTAANLPPTPPYCRERIIVIG